VITPGLRLSPGSPLDLDVDVLVVGVLPGEDGPAVQLDAPGLADAARLAGATGAVDEVVRIPFPGAAAGSVALVGLGPAPVTAESLRYAAGSGARQVRGAAALGFALPTAGDADVQAVLEGAAIGAYAYTEYRSAATPAAKTPATTIVVAADADDAVVRRADAAARAVALVRDLVNAPPNDLHPAAFADRAREAADGLDVEVTVLDEQALADGGYGGILGVGQGSSRPPRLVVVRWAPPGAARHLALVGKGITFDSGGLSLKPAASMVGMKYDMTGAATVLATALAAARLELPVAVTAWLCIAENMPSGTAIRPNDVLRMRDGSTVEVLNTDAEGRLVLADGLVDASAEHPDAIVDVATLTGAARVALGNRYTGVMGDPALAARVVELAGTVGEPMWPMPLPGELRALLNSDVADIANAKPGNTAAGMLLAAVFLREFVGRTSDDAAAERIPWAHLDIAGPANNDGGGYGFTGRGPTGVAVRTLIALAGELSRA